MNKHFSYSRKGLVHKLDEQGNKIPKKDETGVEVPGQFETEERIYKDSFNLDKVIRTMQISDNNMIVLLDDGHEVTDTQKALKNPSKGPVANNVVDVKSRIWVQSEIYLEGEDINRYYEAIN